MMELTRTKFTDSAGYEIPLPNHSEPYTDLGPVSPEYRTYDALKPSNNKSPERICGVIHKQCICVLAVSVVLTVITALSGVVAYLILIRKSSFSCNNCKIGNCAINSTGYTECIFPENRFKENCENILQEPFKVSQCPVGWNDEGQYGCYKVFSKPIERKSWMAAREMCRLMGSNLASVLNLNEQNIIKKLQIGKGNVWIGMSRITGLLAWSDGSKATFFNWSPGEPNNAYGVEHCVHLWNTSQWNDNNCHYSLGFICQMPKTDVCGNSGNWTYYNSKCNMFINNTLNRRDAANSCKRWEGSLVNVNSKEDHYFILSQVAQFSPNDFWIGSNNLRYTGTGNPTSKCPKCSLFSYGIVKGTNCSGRNKYICSFTPG